MPRSLSRAAAIAVAASALAAAPAGAATATVGGACFTYASASLQQPIPVSVAGLAPGQPIQMRLLRGDAVVATGSTTADAAGNVAGGFGSWFPKLGSSPTEKRAEVQAVDPATGTVLAATTTKLTTLDVSVAGKRGLRSWKVSGLTPLTGKRTYYAHYFNQGKYRGRLKIGTAKTACGLVKAKRPLTPFSKIGRYDVRITTSKKFNDQDPFIPGSVVVTKL